MCPVDAFREGPNFLVIDPDVCIDCTVCVAECPVDAIFADGDVPARLHDYIALNAELAPDWPPIVARKAPLPEAGRWATIEQKRELLKSA
ncbi:MAG TPA: ferredoxin family protein [Casimicrobiaceae bacterium]